MSNGKSKKLYDTDSGKSSYMSEEYATISIGSSDSYKKKSHANTVKRTETKTVVKSNRNYNSKNDTRTVKDTIKRSDESSSSKREIEKKLERQMVLDDLVYKFNTVVKSMMNHIIDYYGDAQMTGMQKMLIDIIDESPDEPISCFLMNIYKNDNYRRNILAQNDKFFIGHDYNDVTNGDEESKAKMFEFKELWKRIDNDTKSLIKKSMMALVKICEKYILKLTDDE